MKGVLITITVVCGLILAVFGLSALVECVSVDSKTTADYEIVKVENSISGRNNVEYTIFTVRRDNDSTYTLPKIRTSYVRTYHEGDILPVTIKNYKNGTYEINVDMDRLHDKGGQYDNSSTSY